MELIPFYFILKVKLRLRPTCLPRLAMTSVNTGFVLDMVLLSLDKGDSRPLSSPPPTHLTSRHAGGLEDIRRGHRAVLDSALGLS